MIIKGRAPGEQICWSEPWTGFSARTSIGVVWPVVPWTEVPNLRSVSNLRSVQGSCQ